MSIHDIETAARHYVDKGQPPEPFTVMDLVEGLLSVLRGERELAAAHSDAIDRIEKLLRFHHCGPGCARDRTHGDVIPCPRVDDP